MVDQEKINELDQMYEEIEKNTRIRLTKFLLSKNCDDPKKISKIWKVSIKTAKEYMEEAKEFDFDPKEGEADIRKIKEEKNISWYEAVDIFDKNLIRPLGHGHYV